MSRFLLIFLLLSSLFLLSACNDNDSSTEASAKEATADDDEDTDAANDDDDDNDDDNENEAACMATCNRLAECSFDESFNIPNCVQNCLDDLDVEQEVTLCVSNNCDPSNQCEDYGGCLIHCGFFGECDDQSEQPPENPGSHQVGFYWVSYQMHEWGNYNARIYYPAESNGHLAPPDESDGQYPAIVAGNGLGGAEWNLTWLPTHLASHGYIVLCFTPPWSMIKVNTKWADGFVGGLARLKEENDQASSPIHKLLDTETIGAIGFSMGGCGIMETTADPDTEFDVAVSMACGPEGVPFAEQIGIPIQFQLGSLDGHMELVTRSYESVLSPPKMYVEINGGNHAGFLDGFFGNIAVFLGIEPPADISFAEQQRISSRYFTSWFQYYLKGKTEYGIHLFGWEALQDRYCREVLSDWRYEVDKN